MKRFCRYDVEYAILENHDKLIQVPIEFGPINLNPGDRIVYMGDGRPHRSFAMKEGFSLQYVGYVCIDDSKFLLFTVPERQEFQKYGVYYSFLFHNPPHALCLYNGVGSREIFLKDVVLANSPPVVKPMQLSIFDI